MKAIVGGMVYPVSQAPIPGGTVLVDGERILAVGRELPVPEGAEVFDATGLNVIPGLIDCHSHAGLWEDGFGWEGDDVNELAEPVTPHLRAVDGINPDDIGLREAARAGVTAVWCAPGSANVIGGQGVAIHTVGTVVDDMIIKEPCGLKGALGENPKRCYGVELKKSPVTRMGTAAVLREALTRARNYEAKRQQCLAKGEPVEVDVRLEPLAKLLRGELRLRLHAHRADDIMTGLRIAREFHLDLCIDHCTEGHKIADKLAAAGVPAVVGPGLTARVKVELRELDFSTAGVCAKAGVKVAITTDHPVVPLKYLPLCVGLAIRAGLPWEEGLKAVTVNAAQILGIADQVGTLDPGKFADIAVFKGDPFSMDGQAVAVMVKGQWV
ncbi:MAG: amidohydrolase [Bacillota bacterium]